MGDASFCERGALELGQLLSWQKMEKGLESCEKNIGAFENCESSDQTIKSFFFFFVSILELN